MSEIQRQTILNLLLPKPPNAKSYKTQPDICETSDDNFVVLDDKQAQPENEGKLKKHCCSICNKLVVKLLRHASTKHRDHPDVVPILAARRAERRKLLEALRGKGNFQHNTAVLSGTQAGKIISKRQTSGLTLPCKNCLNFYGKSSLSKHMSHCSPKSENDKYCRVQTLAGSLLPCDKAASELLKNRVLTTMRPDEISFVLKADNTIIKYGNMLVHRYRKLQHLDALIVEKLRRMAKLLIRAREMEPSIRTLVDCFKPNFFEMLCEAAEHVANYNEDTLECDSPSTAINIGHSINHCCNIVESTQLKAMEDTSKINNFQKLMKIEWHSRVSKDCLDVLSKRKFNKPDALPNVDDIDKLMRYVEREAEEAYTSLLDDFCPKKFFLLSKMSLAYLTVFNRRRVGEAQRVLKCEFDQRQRVDCKSDIYKGFSKEEKSLSDELCHFTTRGKHGHRVPILMPKKVEAHVCLLEKYRKKAGIANSRFLFAMRNGKEFRAGDIIAQISKKCGASEPTLLSSTKLRKQMATQAQTLGLTKPQKRGLSTFMGHSEATNSKFYCLPDRSFQIAKIGKMLVSNNSGGLQTNAGRSLDSNFGIAQSSSNLTVKSRPTKPRMKRRILPENITRLLIRKKKLAMLWIKQANEVKPKE